MTLSFRRFAIYYLGRSNWHPGNKVRAIQLFQYSYRRADVVTSKKVGCDCIVKTWLRQERLRELRRGPAERRQHSTRTGLQAGEEGRTTQWSEIVQDPNIQMEEFGLHANQKKKHEGWNLILHLPVHGHVSLSGTDLRFLWSEMRAMWLFQILWKAPRQASLRRVLLQPKLVSSKHNEFHWFIFVHGIILSLLAAFSFS